MPNTPACVFSLAVVCVRLFAAPVEAGYVTSSAPLFRPPSHYSRVSFFSPEAVLPASLFLGCEVVFFSSLPAPACLGGFGWCLPP